MIEFAAFEALKRRGIIKKDLKVVDIREYSLANLMHDIKPFVYRPIYDNAGKVIRIANNILHSKSDKIVVSEEEAFNSTKSVFAIVEDIFK